MESLRHKNEKNVQILEVAFGTPYFSSYCSFSLGFKPMVALVSLFLQAEAKHAGESTHGLLTTGTVSQAQKTLLSRLKTSLQFSFKREDYLEVRTARTV